MYTSTSIYDVTSHWYSYCCTAAAAVLLWYVQAIQVFTGYFFSVLQPNINPLVCAAAPKRVHCCSWESLRRCSWVAVRLQCCRPIILGMSVSIFFLQRHRCRTQLQLHFLPCCLHLRVSYWIAEAENGKRPSEYACCPRGCDYSTQCSTIEHNVYRVAGIIQRMPSDIWTSLILSFYRR